MAHSKVGQYRLEFTASGFTNPSRTHVFGVWVAPLTTPAPGTLPADIDIQLLGGGSNSLDAVALAHAERVRPFYASGISISNYTLWRYDTENARTFIAAGTVTPTAAAGAGITIAWQVTVSFRHANGGISFHTFLETFYSGHSYLDLYNVAVPAGIQDYRDYILSNISPCIALDNSFPVQGLKFGEEENEFWHDKIYRP